MNKRSDQFYRKVLFLLFLFFVIVSGVTAQSSIIMSTANCSIGSDEIQMDILVTNSGKEDLRWNGCVLRMNIPAGFIPAGNQKFIINYLGGSDFPGSFPEPGNQAAGAFYNPKSNVLCWGSTPNFAYHNKTCTAPAITPGQTKTIGRFSFKIKDNYFKKTAKVNFSWHITSSCILYENCNPYTVGFGNDLNRLFTQPCKLEVPD